MDIDFEVLKDKKESVVFIHQNGCININQFCNKGDYRYAIGEMAKEIVRLNNLVDEYVVDRQFADG